MQFRDLRMQYNLLKPEIDEALNTVMRNSCFVGGEEVKELEHQLAEYVGVKHCITCANGTDALMLALRAWNIGPGDAVFVPDFTFFASGEVVATLGATPVFVDVFEETYNLDFHKLEDKIKEVKKNGKLQPKVIIAVDLFGQPADYAEIREIAQRYNLRILEDGAQGFGGTIHDKRVGSFGDIATTSFFPAKPLGCYGDGGAIFTDCDEEDKLIRSYCVHGKGKNKYDNVRIGYNSRLDTIQAAILLVKFRAFVNDELTRINTKAAIYNEGLSSFVKTPIVRTGYTSSWAQYTIQLRNETERDRLQKYLYDYEIPTMIYYPKPLHSQEAFRQMGDLNDLAVTNKLTKTVLSLPIGPYLCEQDQNIVINRIRNFFDE